MATDLIAVMDTGERMLVRMPATLDSIDEADAAISGRLERVVPPSDLFAARIILREAVLNAVTHGSGNDACKQVEVAVEFDKDGVTMKVRDEGAGFDWARATGDFDITGDGGRGLALMRIYSSDMTFNASGNCVVLRRDYTRNG